MYPENRINSLLDKFAKILVPYTAECGHQLEFRSKNKDQPWGVANIYHPTQVKKNNKVESFQKDGCKVIKSTKLIT